MLREAKSFVKRELVLLIALLLAACSSLFHTPDWHCIDIDVLSVLFSLMLVIAGLKSVSFLDWLAQILLNKCTTLRSVTGMLVVLTFVSSMFVTNDVALITFVPLSLIIGKMIKLDMIRSVIFMTVAANLGSMLTPQGNPQNLFLYTHYSYTATEFLQVMAIPTILSALLLAVMIWRTRNVPVTLILHHLPKPDIWRTTTYLLLLVMNIGAVLHYLDKWYIIIGTLITVTIINHKLLTKVDYSLLLTFVGFFVFINNVQETSFVTYLKNSLLGSSNGTYLAALTVSQFISNVPAAMLLAGITNQANALLLGVNIGGLGTLIASMASVISYKLFALEHPYQAIKYLETFLFYNFICLLLLAAATWFVCIY